MENSELSEYEILGLSHNATFNEVKNNYHLFSRYYHPDSHYKIPGIINLTKEEKNYAYQKITMAYNSLKKKLKVNEVDLPKIKINYEEVNVREYNELRQLKKLDEQGDIIDNLELFNGIFEKYHKIQSKDEPYSIYYSEPIDSEKNLNESIIEINESNLKLVINNYEFGINYVDDHSTESYRDIRYIEDTDSNIKEETFEDVNKKSNKVQLTIDNLLENLIKERGDIYHSLSYNDEFENENKTKILNSKQKIDKQRQERLFIE